MIRLPVDIINQIALYLDAISGIRLQSITRYLRSNVVISNNFYDIDSRFLCNIDNTVLRRYSYITKVDISYNCGNIADPYLPEVIWLKSRMFVGNVALRYDLTNMRNLKVVENVLIDRRRNKHYDILIMMYYDDSYRRYSPLYKHDRILIQAPCIKPYVLILNTCGVSSESLINVSNVQVLQVIYNGLPSTIRRSANPYVLIMKICEVYSVLGYLSNFEDMKMSNLKCMAHMILYMDITNAELQLVIDSMLVMYPALVELYIIVFHHCEVPMNIVLDQHPCIRYVKVVYIQNQRHADTTCMQRSTTVYSNLIGVYTPSILDKVDDCRYSLNMVDICALYKHFDIPICEEMIDLFMESLRLVNI